MSTTDQIFAPIIWPTHLHKPMNICMGLCQNTLKTGPGKMFTLTCTTTFHGRKFQFSEEFSTERFRQLETPRLQTQVDSSIARWREIWNLKQRTQLTTSKWLRMRKKSKTAWICGALTPVITAISLLAITLRWTKIIWRVNFERCLLGQNSSRFLLKP